MARNPFGSGFGFSPYAFGVGKPMHVRVGGFGATAGAGGLGSERRVGDAETLQPGHLYTFRTFSLEPLNEDAEANVQERWVGGWHTSWWRELHQNCPSGTDIGCTGSGLVPPLRVRSLWQDTTPTPYSGPLTQYRGRRVYRTSLTFGVDRSGVTGAQAKLRAINILNGMRRFEGPPPNMVIFESNELYERGVRDEAPAEPGLLDRIVSTVTGEDPAAAARRRQREAAAERTRALVFQIGAVATFALGIFLATRKGSSKVEAKLSPVIGKALSSGASAAKSGARAAGRAAVVAAAPVRAGGAIVARDISKAATKNRRRNARHRRTWREQLALGKRLTQAQYQEMHAERAAHSYRIGDRAVTQFRQGDLLGNRLVRIVGSQPSTFGRLWRVEVEGDPGRTYLSSGAALAPERAENRSRRRNAGGYRDLTEDERALLTHLGLWGSDGYPVRKMGKVWVWGPWRSIKGPPVVFKTRKAAVASFERYYDLLVEMSGAEAKERYEAELRARRENRRGRRH